MTTPLRHLLLPLLAVLVLHWAGLHWLLENMPRTGPFTEMAEPLFIRVLEPALPAKIAQEPKPAQAKKKKARAAFNSAGVPAAPTVPDAPVHVPATPDLVAETPSAEPIAQTEPLAAEPLSAPAPEDKPADKAAEPKGDPVDRWPLDTRLSYRLGGYYRGELHGSARVQWQRDQSGYQVRLSVSAAGLTLATLTSQGEATAGGLVPRVYEEQVPGGLRRAEFNDGLVKFQNGNVALLPAGAQDTVSQFVDLAHRFSTGRETLAAGTPVRVWLARPGGLDEWIYDVGEVETLHTPELGAVPAFHLTPRPLANPRGAITAELWFAPSLQYLPVRVRIVLGGGDFVDLMIERIEQAQGVAPAK